MHDNDVKKVSPVLSHHVSHSFVPGDGKEEIQAAVHVWTEPMLTSADVFTYTKPKGLLVMRKSFFPWLTSRCKTAWVSSPLWINLSGKKHKGVLHATMYFFGMSYGNLRAIQNWKLELFNTHELFSLLLCAFPVLRSFVSNLITPLSAAVFNLSSWACLKAYSVHQAQIQLLKENILHSSAAGILGSATVKSQQSCDSCRHLKNKAEMQEDCVASRFKK